MADITNLLLSAQAELLNMKKQMENLQLDKKYLEIQLKERDQGPKISFVQTPSSSYNLQPQPQLNLHNEIVQLTNRIDLMEKQLNNNTLKIDNVIKIYHNLQGLVNMKATLDSVVVKQGVMEKRLNEVQGMGGKKAEQVPKQFGPKILVMGGFTKSAKATDNIYSFDITKKNWQRMSYSLPYKASFHGTVSIGESIYVFGGKDVNENSLDLLYFMKNGSKWMRLANMLEKRKGINSSSVVVNDEIWVLGGCNDSNVLNTVEKYSPKTNFWTQMGPMKEPRAAGAAAVVKGRIFICGGHSGTNYLDSTEVYDPKTGVSTQFINMPSPRECFTALGSGQDLYVFGGHEESNWHSTVWKINVDVKFGQWTILPPMKQIHAGCSAISIGKEILVIGGLGVGGQPIPVLDIYNEGKNIWEKGVSMPKTLEPPACYGIVLLPGGVTNKPVEQKVNKMMPANLDTKHKNVMQKK